MEPAIKRIVDTYVRLRNRRAIEELLMHRRRLAIDLKARKGSYDFSRPIAQIDEELAIILAALDKLEPVNRSMATRSLMTSLAAS
jgi:GGDEF domain-containing protein